MSFRPVLRISPKLARQLMRIEAARQAVSDLPVTAAVLATLRETARLFSTHYSTMIEGNRLTQEQVAKVIDAGEHFAGRTRDEKEVLGYYAALERLETYAARREALSETHIRTLHALVMAGGRTTAKPSPYRDGQNVIRDSRSRRIVYMPPVAKDVPLLMKDLVAWLSARAQRDLPCPIRAAIAHYLFATIHPYYDGNGRTARLLTSLVLHLGGYDLKGLYSLEEYYARNLGAYYDALSVGPSHNYYEGRAEADITPWLEYFCEGMADSFESVKRRALEAGMGGARDDTALLLDLDPRQRKALALFGASTTIASRDVAQLFAISERAARNLLSAWVASGFVETANAARKTRRYGLGEAYRGLVAR
jgi:Fic family protein